MRYHEPSVSVRYWKIGHPVYHLGYRRQDGIEGRGSAAKDVRRYFDS